MNRLDLLKLHSESDSNLTHMEHVARNSVLARGLPYYGVLKKIFNYHWASFMNMHQRPTHVDPKYDRNRDGFINFIVDISEVPPDMMRPSIGRIDHNLGYIPGNFMWQEFSDNARDGGKRAPHPSSRSNSFPDVKKRRTLENFVQNNKGSFHCQDILKMTGRTDGRRLLEYLEPLPNTAITRFKSRHDFDVVIS